MPRAESDRSRLVAKFVPGAAVLGIFALYLPFLGVPFEYDDKVEIVANEVLRSPSQFKEMWAYNPFRVLLLYTFAADIWAWGILRPEGFRFLNIVIHSVNTLLLWSLLARLGSGPKADRGAPSHSLFVAAGTLLFAFHPLAIESVTYVSGRSSSLATTFVLLALRSYLRYRELGRSKDAAAWQAVLLRRSNRLLGLALSAALVTGIPAALLTAREVLAPSQAILYAAAATGAILLVLVASVGRKWLNERPPTLDPEAKSQAFRSLRFYLLAFGTFILGCLTKEIAAVLPACLLLLEAHWFHSSWKGALGTLRGRLFPFFAIPAALIVLRAVTYGYVASPVFVRPWTVNLLTQFEVIWQYGRLWLIPYPQSIYHDYPTVLPPGSLLTWTLAAALVAALFFALRSRDRRPALAFGLLFLGIGLAPTSSVFALKETMVEHRTYLSSVGFAFVVAWFFGLQLPRWLSLRASAILLGLLVSLYGTLHVSYDLLWRSEEVLWSHAVHLNPKATDAWRNLGDFYLGQTRLRDATTAYRSAVQARPGNIEARSSLGIALALSGRLDEAEQELEQCLLLAPCHFSAINNLAQIQARRKAFDRAVDLYDRSLQCDPENPMAHLGLGEIYDRSLNNRQKAAMHYERFLAEIDPIHPSVQRIQARVLELTW